MQTAAYKVFFYHLRENDSFYLEEENPVENVHKTTLEQPFEAHSRTPTIQRTRSMFRLLSTRTPYSEPAPLSAEVSNSSSQDRGDPFFVGLTHRPTPGDMQVVDVFQSRNASWYISTKKTILLRKTTARTRSQSWKAKRPYKTSAED